MTTDEELAAAAADYRAAQHRIRAAVARARQDGLSWAAIGRHFGISKQAAAKKWALELAWSAPLEIDREGRAPT